MAERNWEGWLEGAVRIVEEAGDLLMSGFGRLESFDLKGEVDLVTEMDRRSERFVVESLSRFTPGVAFLAEEGGATGGAGSRGLWILDPLDGTTNYAHGFPVFAVSLALEWDGELVLGIVHDPTRRETFSAAHGRGAFRNGERLQVTRRKTLSESLLATGFPYDIRTSPENNLRRFQALALKARGIRRAGAAAIDLAYVAAGRFDGYWEEKISAWDVAAGVLLVREAGGTVTDYAGGPADIRGRRIVATNGQIHGELVAALAAADPT
jgi:myo-inositol-1(or 4)-monophosphatase